MSERWVSYLFDGRELRVLETDSGWKVGYEGVVCENRHLDVALGRALGRSGSQAAGIAARILTRAPGTEVER